ncbi:MAG: hypothetical protein IPM54_32985 [Polyangiaceae bacterium]|nr:hypothetical protein [Polyangiaceae bacterium]
MPDSAFVRILDDHGSVVNLAVTLVARGPETAAAWTELRQTPGTHLLLVGDRDYAVTLQQPIADNAIELLEGRRRKAVRVVFPGRPAVRRRLEDLIVVSKTPEAVAPEAVDLTDGRTNAAPLWLLADGSFSTDRSNTVQGNAAGPALVTAARWISSRRTTTFERLFAPSAFHPDEPLRPERLTAEQARGLLKQLRSALQAAAVEEAFAKENVTEAAQIRSAALTVLSHIVATALRDPGFRGVADEAAAEMFSLVEREHGPSSMPALRAHAIALLSMRAPALSEADADKARLLVKSLVREAPPYDELTGPWRFAMCSAHDFHEGEADIFVKKYGFRDIELPEGSPAPPWGSKYRVLEAPFKNPHGKSILLYSRSASPSDENHEMGVEFFTGVTINRHAQLGAYDMRASMTKVQQVGYKLMLNSQCAGLTTRFAISRIFPDADIYSSWDSTYFRTDSSGKLSDSEGADCFHAMLQGMCARETHQQIEARMRKVQWYHKQGRFPGFSQFVGPGNPLVFQRFQDVNHDGKADLYDGFLDFTIAQIAEDVRNSVTPRDPGVSASQIGGDAATGLAWAAGSMNRVTQYSNLWESLPGQTELFYAFAPGGFYSEIEMPVDVEGGLRGESVGKLPAVCRYLRIANGHASVQAEIMFHARLSHAGKEFKRLLCAADAMWRAFDTNLLSDTCFETIAHKRAGVLLMLAGLLEFPADQNFIDGLWTMALETLRFPSISRSLVRACITEADHDASNYYGSRRGLKQLLDDLKKADPLAREVLDSEDPSVGRAKEIAG